MKLYQDLEIIKKEYLRYYLNDGYSLVSASIMYLNRIRNYSINSSNILDYREFKTTIHIYIIY